ncbi:lipid A deacylase LpxR family protein [Kaarinaea lacus]
MPFRITLFICAFFCAAPVTAEISFPDNWGAGLYMDQDLAVPVVNEDRDYTMGIAAEFFWQDKDAGLYPLDGTVRQIGQWLGLHEKGDQIVRSFILGSVTYTPDDLSDPDPIYDDRPYASLVYLGNKRVRVNRNNAVGVELQVGILGLDYSGNIQTGLHRFYRETFDDESVVDPEGWDHQVSDGGELTLRLRASNSRLLLESPNTWDLSHYWSASLGYQTNVSIGLSGRFGRITSSPWTLPFDPINRGNFLPALSGNEWYLWAAYRLRLVLYDALLQGQFRDSDVTFDYDEIRHLIHEGGFGMTFTYQPLQFTIAVNGKTPELESGILDRNHYWGGLYFVYRY